MKSPVCLIQVPEWRFSHIHVNWLSLFLNPMGSPTSSPSLNIQPDGQRQFLFTKLQQKIVLMPFHTCWFLCSDLNYWVWLVPSSSSSSTWPAKFSQLRFVNFSVTSGTKSSYTSFEKIWFCNLDFNKYIHFIYLSRSLSSYNIINILLS